MTLPLDGTVRIGVTSRLATPAEIRETVALADDLGLDSLWCGEHIAYTSPILDPFVRLSYAAALSERLVLGTGVYLVPLRPAAAIAKQVVSIDHLSGGRFVFGAGVGGEFPGEFDACGVDVRERGARLDEAIDVMRALWTGEPVSFRGRFVQFEGVHMQPPPLTPGGPPIWCGARQEAALRRIGRKADGWMSYVVTPQRYAEGLQVIEAAARESNRTIERFDSAHLLFVRIDDSRDRALDDATEILSRRYAMDFRRAAERYCALGHPDEVAASVNEFLRAGVRHVILDLLGDWDESRPQLERFARGGAAAAPVRRRLNQSTTPKFVTGFISGTRRPRGRAACGRSQRRNSPLPRSTRSSPPSTTRRPRESTVTGHPLMRRPS